MRSLASGRPLLALLALALASGCRKPPNDPPRDGADGADVSIARSDAAGAPATAQASAPPVTTLSPKPGACNSDADCRTWSSYCTEAPCGCRALAKNDGDPRCLGGGKVSCLVDPCMNKAARCQSGACALTVKGSAAATEK